MASPGSPGRHARPFTCPDCSRTSRYAEDGDYGYCPHCGKFTGLCDAGRALYYPGFLAGGNWQVPCRHPWVARWNLWLSRPGSSRQARLCTRHGTSVSLGRGPVRGVVLARRSPEPAVLPRRGPVEGTARALRMMFREVTDEDVAEYRLRQAARARRKARRA